VVIVASTVSWKSVDGGKTWAALRGAPGGDDYQNVWINPNNSDVIILGSDQGAVVTTNGGRTWSNWYNQPTAQMYHVSADNAFPYRLCSGQQESGSACVASRGNDGEITFREWHPVAAEEYGLRSRRPARPGHRLWRQADAIRPAHLASSEHHAEAISQCRFSGGAHTAGFVLAGRSTPCCISPRIRFGRRETVGGTGNKSVRT
jgi:hypothetical protein